MFHYKRHRFDYTRLRFSEKSIRIATVALWVCPAMYASNLFLHFLSLGNGWNWTPYQTFFMIPCVYLFYLYVAGKLHDWSSYQDPEKKKLYKAGRMLKDYEQAIRERRFAITAPIVYIGRFLCLSLYVYAAWQYIGEVNINLIMLLMIYAFITVVIGVSIVVLLGIIDAIKSK